MAIWSRSARRTPEDPATTAPEPHETAGGVAVQQAPAVEDSLAHASPHDVTPEEEDAERVGLPRRPGLRGAVLDSTTMCLFWAAHPVQAVLTAAGVAVAAALSGRALREVLVVAATVLVGQAVLGWHNDVVDRERDAEHLHGHSHGGATDRPTEKPTRRKPLADGRLDPGTAWFALVVGLLLVLPLSLSTGVTAGVYYLISVLVGILGNVALRQGRFSWVAWAASYALLPFYLSWGGWGGGARDSAPQVAIVVVAALLGVGVHTLRAGFGLPADQEEGWTYYPLRLGRRLGASRLVLLAGGWCVVMLGVLGVLGATVGLRA